MRSAFPISVAERLLRLWDEREVLLRALDRVPHTFCHLDAWRRNMFAPVGGEGPQGLTLIDWAYPGLGAVGTDVGDLFGESFCLSELGDVGPEVFDRAIFESYVLGLQEAGWKGDVRSVRFAFTTFCSLKHLFLIFVSLRDVWNENGQVVWERLFGRPFDEYVHRQANLLYYLFDLANEAQGSIV
jgi:thiamine kinase-like enzyme